MTDEEKVEEILQTKGSMTFCAKGCGYTEKVKELIAIGLAEGRKEGYEQGKNNERESQCGKKNYEKDIVRLEKENAELKAQNEKMKCCGNCRKELVCIKAEEMNICEEWESEK